MTVNKTSLNGIKNTKSSNGPAGSKGIDPTALAKFRQLQQSSSALRAKPGDKPGNTTKPYTPADGTQPKPGEIPIDGLPQGVNPDGTPIDEQQPEGQPKPPGITPSEVEEPKPKPVDLPPAPMGGGAPAGGAGGAKGDEKDYQDPAVVAKLTNEYNAASTEYEQDAMKAAEIEGKIAEGEDLAGIATDDAESLSQEAKDLEAKGQELIDSANGDEKKISEGNKLKQKAEGMKAKADKAKAEAKKKKTEVAKLKADLAKAKEKANLSKEKKTEAKAALDQEKSKPEDPKNQNNQANNGQQGRS